MTSNQLAAEPQAAISVVDYRQLRSDIPEQRLQALETLDATLQRFGFAYIANIPIEPTRVAEAFRRSRAFFALPEATKTQVAHPPSGEVDDNRGWARTGLGHTVQMVFDTEAAQQIRRSHPDFKETLELGSCSPAATIPNRWLSEEELPGFRAFMESWWQDCVSLTGDLFQSLEEILSLDDHNGIGSLHSADNGHMTLNYYPSLPIELLQQGDQKRLNAHTDFGSITLVFQDDVGGLEVHDGDEYHSVPPISGTVIINVGDMLEQLSNGRWKSALHRVVGPTAHGKSRSCGAETKDGYAMDRLSLVYFAVPDSDKVIEPLKGCEELGRWTPNMQGPWGVLTAKEWIAKRLAVEFE